MKQVFSYFYFWLIFTTFTNSTSIWIKNMTINFGQIIHTTSNSTTTTLWIIKNGQNNLTPCYLDFQGQSCTELILPTTLHYTKVSQVRQRYDFDFDVTTYLFSGISGEICFKYPTSIRCENDFNAADAYSFRFNFGPSSLIIYSSISFSPDRSYINKHTSLSDSLTQSVQLMQIPNQEIQDIFFQNNVLNTFGYDILTFSFDTYRVQGFINDGIMIYPAFSPIVYDTSDISQYFNTKFKIKQYGNMVYAYSFAGLFVYQFFNPLLPSGIDSHGFQFHVYDLEIVTDTAYIVSDQGLLQYSLTDKSIIKIPLNTIDPSQTFIKMLGGIDAFLLVERGKQNIQFYQYQNFQNDLSLLFFEQQQTKTEKISKSSFEKICLESQFQGCKLFCENSCLECNISPTNCSMCKPLYYLNDNNHCVPSSITSLVTGLAAIISLFRPQKFQLLLFFVENLNNYNFHRTQYTGFFKQILQYVHSIQDQIWSLLPFDSVKNWMEKSLPLQSYTPYTSLKYQEMQRGDSMFFQNTKEFFLVYFTFTIFIFIIFNRLFRLLSHLQISKHIRIYSFWFYALFLVIFQNWQQLLIISLTHLFNIFSFDISTKMIQFASLFVISIIFILCIAIFPMIYYFYNKHSTYFLSNISFTSYSWIIMLFQFVIFSGIETTIHICMTENPGIQKLLLFANGILFMISSFFFFTKFKIFTSQGIFWIELILRSLFSMLNFLLYFRYDYPDFGEIAQPVDILIEALLNCFMVLIIIQGIYPLIDFIGIKISEKIKTNNIQISKNIQNLYQQNEII